ncbi:ABC-type transport system involved in multi-copper enzyme maturation, permease component [Verrucomicrobium sp. GAS474]|uniref:hypothetical protein n=1 Tax=Verrucomicrobium sp. GAS474 TaxID=1882831 RepID=UPI00087B70B3|nr:hypothetical protein [Verrucomicrobium sp. GAS474]SDU08367.1 ABC-type transport system involved in multi-copper enzyme maturation, permease component [Verrucomicrobium sp. GAS474]
MKLFLHQFKKDFRETWGLWLVWALLVLVQFGLAAWNVDPWSPVRQGFYGQVIDSLPLLHSLILFVLIPALLLQEPAVGVSASWLTRPMPRTFVLGSKLASLFLLVLFPLLGQCAVLASHHIVPRDVAFAGLEIALRELSWIATGTALAVFCANFGQFLIAAAILYAAQMFGDWIWSGIATLLLKVHPVTPSFSPADPLAHPFLYQSRSIASDLLRILFCLGVLLFQYTTRRTRIALVCAVAGFVLSETALRYWPWDFVDPLVAALPAPTAFDASGLRVQPDGNHNLSTQADPKKGPLKSLSINLFPTPYPLDQALSFTSEGGEIVYPDGSRLPLPTMRTMWEFSGIFSSGSIGYGGNDQSLPFEAAIGHLPLLNSHLWLEQTANLFDLFTLDGETYDKNEKKLGAATFRLNGRAASYRITAELPLKAGAVAAWGSHRLTLVEVHKPKTEPAPPSNAAWASRRADQGEGISLTLRERTLSLLFQPLRPDTSGRPPVYLLVNRKRGEAIQTNDGNGYNNYIADRVSPGPRNAANPLLSKVALGGIPFETTFPSVLTFGTPSPDRNAILPVPIDDAWLADAVLVRLEPAPDATFTLPLSLPEFALDGHTLPNYEETHPDYVDPATLRQIVLPPNPTRAEVWKYILRVAAVSGRQRNNQDKSLQVSMLAAVSPAHAQELLIAYGIFVNVNQQYVREALEALDLRQSPPGTQAMLFRLLPAHTELVDLLHPNHWEEDAKPILLRKLAERERHENIDYRWLQALDSLHDDKEVKDAFLALLPDQGNIGHFILDHHWEAEAKPILLDAIANAKSDARFDNDWIRSLSGFAADPAVKAALLRILPNNAEAIDAVVENHWETEAKPILIAAIAAKKPGDNVDNRWVRVLDGFHDDSAVKASILRALQTNQDQIGIVLERHWEADAKPIILAAVSEAKPERNFNAKWMKFLASYPDDPDAKRAVLHVLPWEEDAVDAVVDAGWMADAKPILLDEIARSKPDREFPWKWMQFLASYPDDPETKALLLRLLPSNQRIIEIILQNHWENEAFPIVLQTLTERKPNTRYNDRWFDLLNTFGDRPGVKEAVLRSLPANSHAISPVVDHHWEAEAKPTLVAAIAAVRAGQGIDRFWVQALASLRAPDTYDVLLDYAERVYFNYNTVFNDLRALPGPVVAARVEKFWNLNRTTWDEGQVITTAAEWGLPDALDRAIELLSEPPGKTKKEKYIRDTHRDWALRVLRFTIPVPSTLLDEDIPAWYAANKAKYAFDPILGRFVLHPRLLPPNAPWPASNDYFKNLGTRAAKGETAALDEVEAALARAREGADPKLGGNVAARARELAFITFGVLRDEAVPKTPPEPPKPLGFAKNNDTTDDAPPAPEPPPYAFNPDILRVLDYASTKEALRPFVPIAFSRAAERGNETALDALIHYQKRQLALADVLFHLANATRKGNPVAVDFVAGLRNDPNADEKILNDALGQLRAAANNGNEKAKAAYRTLSQNPLPNPTPSTPR